MNKQSKTEQAWLYLMRPIEGLWFTIHLYAWLSFQPSLSGSCQRRVTFKETTIKAELNITENEIRLL